MISVVTISFNQRPFLGRCLESVLAQDFDEHEHIVVDPGSTDGSREYLEAWTSERLRLVLQADGGPAEGLNNGFASARGDVILYLNADDELAPHALKRVDQLHRERPEAGVVIGNGWWIDVDSRPIKWSRSDRFTLPRAAMRVGTILQQATSYKRSALPSSRPFNESNRYTWDFELLHDLYVANQQFSYTPDSLGYFRVYPGTISTETSLREAIEAERFRILQGSMNPLALGAYRALEYPARASKKGSNLLRRGAARPFPGLARLRHV